MKIVEVKIERITVSTAYEMVVVPEEIAANPEGMKLYVEETVERQQAKASFRRDTVTFRHEVLRLHEPMMGRYGTGTETRVEVDQVAREGVHISAEVRPPAIDVPPGVIEPGDEVPSVPTVLDERMRALAEQLNPIIGTEEEEERGRRRGKRLS